jgi:DNA-binding XRE family transcriptional regulator
MYKPDIQGGTIGERLKNFRLFYNLNQTEMAKALGIGQVGYSDIERGKNNISLRAIENLVKNYNIDLNWLLNGAAFEKSIGGVAKDMAPYRRSTQIISPIPANAGIPFVYTQEWLHDVSPVNIPGVRGSLVVFPIDGISMLPGVEPGSYLGCRLVERKDHISLGSAYIIVSINGIWIKRITSIDGVVVLSSDNPDYADFSIPYEDVREIYHPIVKIIPFDAADKSGNYMLPYIDIKQK